MKNIKTLIASLCLATALTFSGSFVTIVYAESGDPQDNSTSKPAPSLPPEVIRMILILLGLL